MRALAHSQFSFSRIALFVLWSAVLGFWAQPVSAQSKVDPGNNNAPPTGAILDLNGTPIPLNGTYQQYKVSFVANIQNTAITFAFRDDPAFISLANASVVDTANPDINLLTNGNFAQGIYTNSGNANTPIGWTYADQYGVLDGGGVSSPCGAVTYCWYDGAVQAYDAISQTIPTTVGHTYTISFSVAESSNCGCNFSSLSTNGDTTNTGGNGIDVTVYALDGLPPGSAVTQPFNTSGPTTTTFNHNPGNLVQQTIDATHAGPLTCNGPTNTTVDCTGVQLSTSNMTLSNPPPGLAAVNGAAAAQNAPTFPSFVDGTPWSSALCAGRPGNGGSGDLCSLYVNACYGGNSGVALAAASDFYCPFINTSINTTGYFVLQDTWDPLSQKPPITPGTTVSLLDFVPTSPSETWTGSAMAPNPVCTVVAPTIGNPAISAQCDVSDSLVDVYGDQTTTRGTKPKKGWLISMFNVPMLLSTVQVFSGTGCTSPHSPLNDAYPADPTFENPIYAQNIWNNGNCLLGFTVNPAQTPNPNSNNFVAAPPASLFYGSGAPPVAPGGVPEGDTPLTNPNAVCTGAGLNCGALPWQTPDHKTLSSIFGATDGTFILHWSAKDAVGISEKSVALLNSGQCTTPNGPVNPPCYSTTYFTTIVNLDSTNPTVALVFSPAGGTYSVNQPATGIFACTDPLNNGVASGIATCTASVDGGAVTATSPVPLNTATAGAHAVTVTAVDHAGNTTTQVFHYTVLPDADVAIFEQHTRDKVKPGGTLTYLAWALDLSKTNAAEVTVTEQLQLPAAGVQLGNVTASVAIVTCTWSGCSSMPPSGGGACTVSGTTVTCNIGTLPSIWGWKGALIKTSIPVLNTSKVGTAFKITATVNSPGDLIPGNNTTTDLLTICSPDE